MKYFQKYDIIFCEKRVFYEEEEKIKSFNSVFYFGCGCQLLCLFKLEHNYRKKSVNICKY